VARVQHANIIFINSVFLDQWRYEIDVSINGTTYHLRSLKCIDDKLATTGSACYFPPNPFAVPSSTAASATLTVSGDTAMVESQFVATSLPGDFSLHFKYASENISNPGCDPGTMASIASYLLILKSRSVGGKCPGFTPEVDWTYKPPETNAMTGAEIVQWCETAPASTDGYKICDVPSNVMGSVVASQNYAIVGFQAWLFTRVAPLGNQTMVTTLLQDTTSEFDVAKSMGNLIRANLPSWLIGDMFSEILPISRELEVTVAKPVETRGDWDNFHAKASPWLGRLGLVDYPACTSVLDKTDRAPCFHLHESWLGGPTISKGQTVKWIIVLYKPAEVDPRGLPDDLANGETLFTPAPGPPTSKPMSAYIGKPPVFTQQVIWHESQASSTGCAPPAAGTAGSIDNTARPCAVFVSPIFFTH